MLSGETPPGAKSASTKPKVYLDDKGNPIPDPGDWQIVSEVPSTTLKGKVRKPKDTIEDSRDPYAATAIKANPAPTADPFAGIAEKQTDPFAAYQKPLGSSDVPTKFSMDDAVTPA